MAARALEAPGPNKVLKEGGGGVGILGGGRAA
jgi:hypothetical protein